MFRTPGAGYGTRRGYHPRMAKTLPNVTFSQVKGRKVVRWLDPVSRRWVQRSIDAMGDDFPRTAAGQRAWAKAKSESLIQMGIQYRAGADTAAFADLVLNVREFVSQRTETQPGPGWSRDTVVPELVTRTDLRASLVVVLAVATRRKLDKGPLLAMGDAVREAAHRDDREPGLAEIQAMNGAVEWCLMQLEAITASIRAMSV